MTDAAEEAKVTETTAIQVYQYLHDICSWRLLTHDSPLLLGGPGVVVQIDKSLFRHTPKVHSHKKSLNKLIQLNCGYLTIINQLFK